MTLDIMTLIKFKIFWRWNIAYARTNAGDMLSMCDYKFGHVEWNHLSTTASIRSTSKLEIH